MRVLLALLALSVAAWPQVAGEANRRYQTKEGRENLAGGLGSPSRDKTQKPGEIVAALDLHPGMTVADVGTGVGYMLPFLSKAVGASGKILAEDIQADFLEKVKARVNSEKLANVTLILGAETDPRLPAGSVDVALVLDSYHHFDYPADMLSKIATALAPGGRLVLVDYYKSKESMPGGRGVQHIRIDEGEVIKEVESNGFKLVSSRPFIEKVQYMAVFTRK